MGFSHREFYAAQPDGIEFVSNISSLLKRLKCDDEDCIADTLRQLQKVASEHTHLDLWSLLFSFVHSRFNFRLS
ncbi:hypothetical protein BLNAU_20586 [Blattamonas nauphoetae]|uniref:Uncharacterized protein n=1 Tax=Blattamonas nauphoetae TaxID=2049346 RepID=A0ABQ9WYA0_9EUKA|nr:hypothetical protein BLNAU_20586 [Blattamonas nauphoetae]